MVDDVRKLRVLSHLLTNTRLLKFCHNTGLSYLNLNLPPDVMRNQVCGLQTVDQAMSMEVLQRCTELDLPNASQRHL
jgi:hypothetical protein